MHYALAAGDLACVRVGEAIHEFAFALELIGDDLPAFPASAHTHPNRQRIAQKQEHSNEKRGAQE